MRFARSSHRPKISLIIPFGGRDRDRRKVLRWLTTYWKHELPDAEIIIGRSSRRPFCKTEAFNDAIRRSRGKVLVLLDADAYMSGRIIDRCADNIIEDIDNRLWFVPYRKLYRLTRDVTDTILAGDPASPYDLPVVPPADWIEGDPGHSAYGRRYGAMVMVIPREAYETLGGFDERFDGGWGGEDVSILRALDTLWGKHKSTNNPVYHLWHHRTGTTYLDRVWAGQKKRNVHSHLAIAYKRASRSPIEMRRLVNEGHSVRRGRIRRTIILLFSFTPRLQ